MNLPSNIKLSKHNSQLSNVQLLNNIDENKLPSLVSHNVSATNHILEREEDESNTKYEAVGLKSFNS